ncbi:hypothetical protein F4556_002188 [Kitasatospora gansuensis]|uniref:Uncharacterized protein n=1 Tax=Kitasatospora gansuensis TaxID=258050 RepID=A0A7W7SA37_9ACTN|nr:hypothetical protein [Kitasatospora gansuensis]MBB4946653.1 hypothetical protein [Kitasatospora gansuensis]
MLRPWIGWLTAWSFDRLRLWAEREITPERSRRSAWAEVAVRAGAVVLAVAGPLGAALTALPAVLVPPRAGTPAARRCVRKPPDRTSARAPQALAHLTAPTAAPTPAP